MSKICARPDCGKVVYPLEELKCLDKVWHKQCFKCATCGMVLNMKNYKGYQKVPYCEAHYPKMNASVVADTPEMKRLAENTKNQSLVKYHEDFEKMKGKRTEIADDPEVMRHLKNTAVISQASYHAEVDKKELQDRLRTHSQDGSAKVSPTTPVSPGGGLYHAGIRDEPPGSQGRSPYSAKQQQGPTLIYSSEQGGRVQPQANRSVGKIDDYDPMNGQWGSVATGTRPYQPPGHHQQTASVQPMMQQQQQQMAAVRGVQQAPHPTNQSAATTAHQLARQASQPTRPPSGGAPHQQQPVMHHQQAPAPAAAPAFRAMYDYTAADYDEVSFREGDLIVNCQRVDDGWMTGTVQRTGKQGMLPSNYIEKVH